MINRFKSPLLTLFTVLALLVQGMAFGAQSVMPVSDSAHHAMMMDGMHCAPISDAAHDSNVAMMSDMDDCCSDLQAGSNSCCDSQGSCSGDCIHCLSISVTGTLLNDSYWPEAIPSGTGLIAFVPHFHSISLPMALRPPIG